MGKQHRMDAYRAAIGSLSGEFTPDVRDAYNSAFSIAWENSECMVCGNAMASPETAILPGADDRSSPEILIDSICYDRLTQRGTRVSKNFTGIGPDGQVVITETFEDPPQNDDPGRASRG